MPGGKPIRERRHRPPRDPYRGPVAASFTACVKGRRSIFNDGGMVQELVASLRLACDLHACQVLAYCFMPDHLHAVLLGTSADAHTWMAFVHFK